MPRLINNNRFLILPWVKIRNLASHVLSLSLKQTSIDWKNQYGIEPYMAETFADRERYAGTCYRAANWLHLGKTQGYGRRRNSFIYHGEPKDIYVKIISRRFASQFHPYIKCLHSEREELIAVINGIPAWTPSVIDWTGLPEVISRRDKVLRRVVAALQNTGGLSFRAINGGNIYLCRK